MRGLSIVSRLWVLSIIFLNGSESTESEDFVNVFNTTTEDSLSSTLPGGYSKYPNGNVAYKIHEAMLTWNEARIRCIRDGGDLAIADTVDKNEYIRSLIHDDENLIWVGIHKPYNSKEWIRVDNGLPTTSLPWANRSLMEFGYNCAAIQYDFTLTNIACEWPQRSVCEILINENQVTINNSPCNAHRHLFISNDSINYTLYLSAFTYLLFVTYILK